MASRCEGSRPDAWTGGEGERLLLLLLAAPTWGGGLLRHHIPAAAFCSPELRLVPPTGGAEAATPRGALASFDLLANPLSDNGVTRAEKL